MAMLVFVTAAMASNLKVTNARIAEIKEVDLGGGTRKDTAIIKFDISWDNSWKDNENWDAAWVFVKYYDVANCKWGHAWLCDDAGTYGVGDENGHPVRMTMEKSYIGAAVNGSESREQKNVGCFIFNKNETEGDGVSVNWEDVKLSWLLGEQGVLPTDVQKIKVLAIEMVYIPTDRFQIGDGDWYTFQYGPTSYGKNYNQSPINASNCHWRAVNDAIASQAKPYTVTGSTIKEGVLIGVGKYNGTDYGGVYYNGYLSCFSAAMTANKGDNTYNAMSEAPSHGVSVRMYWTGSTDCNNMYWCSGNYGLNHRNQMAFWTQLPEAYPLGYKAFYCMKTEVSQWLYTEFLNTIPFLAEGYSDDEHPRFPDKFGVNRFNIKRTSEKYIIDANNDNVDSQASDGKWIAVNWMSWQDMEAFADWAGLRPMTELEFEKACRGPYPYMPAVKNEYAWGTTNIFIPSKSAPYSNKNQRSEVIADNSEGGSPITPNCLYNGNDANYSAIDGPTVTGQFARSSSTRQAAGATYYGVLDMSGNVWEICMSVYMNSSNSNPSHTFRYNDHGDGELKSDGTCEANAFLSIGYNGQIYGLRGGGWSTTDKKHLTISNRINAVHGAARGKTIGFRCVRSAADHMSYQ